MSVSERAGARTETGPGTAGLLEVGLPLPLAHRGKVREMYEAGDDRLLMVASDRVSAFDVVMRQPIPRKGEVLTMLTAWWIDRLAGPLAELGAGHHLIAARPEEILERVPELADVPEERWARRSLLVRRARPIPVECVARGYLAGSAWAEYRGYGTLAGERLPEGLRQSQEISPPIFSPATKATEGHDENISFGEVERRLGKERAAHLRDLTVAIYRLGRDVAAERAVILADTKFEFGEAESPGGEGDGRDGEILLIDEVLTPDSSRYWPREDWREGISPPSLDKQPIRDWLDALPDWDRTPPPPDLTPEVIESATERYLEIFRRMTRTEIDGFEPPSFA